MNIAFELPFYGACKRGIDLHFEGLVKALAKIDKVNQYRIFGYWWRDYEAKKARVFCPNQENFKLDIRHWSELMVRHTKRAGLDLAQIYLENEDIDLYFCMNPLRNSTIPCIMWMSSLGPSDRDNFTPKMKLQWEKETLPGMLRADKIIVPSEYVKNRLIESDHRLARKLEAIYWPVDREFLHPIPEGSDLDMVRDKYRLPKSNVFLCVGPFDSSLDMRTVFEAVRNIRRKGEYPLRLVCAGLDEYGYKHMAHTYELDGCAVWTGHLDHCELANLYNIATAVIYPTEFEELGMPLIEAMSCGTPIITGEGGALQEASGGSALHIDVHDPIQMGTAIERMIKDNELRKTARSLGLRRAEQFTWDVIVKRYLEIFEWLWEGPCMTA